MHRRCGCPTPRGMGRNPSRTLRRQLSRETPPDLAQMRVALFCDVSSAAPPRPPFPAPAAACGRPRGATCRMSARPPLRFPCDLNSAIAYEVNSAVRVTTGSGLRLLVRRFCRCLCAVLARRFCGCFHSTVVFDIFQGRHRRNSCRTDVAESKCSPFSDCIVPIAQELDKFRNYLRATATKDCASALWPRPALAPFSRVPC